MTTADRRAVCPGSYDPVTNGHLDVIERATHLYDEVVVAILHNPAKHGTFDIGSRIAFVLEGMAQRPAGPGIVRVEAFGGRLLVDVCREVDARVIVKGIRGTTDFAYELPMALMNRHLSGVETLFLPADPSLEHVSSSLVKEVVRYGGDVTGLVPDPVRDALITTLR